MIWPFRKRSPSPTGPEHDETTPLLDKKRETPLPAKALTILVLMRLTEPISSTQISPYINEMILRSGITDDPKRIGHYSGLVQSLFSVSQLLTIMHWGRLSDRIGRKPVLLMGLSGVLVSTVAFGFQHTFYGLVIARCFSGAMNGNVSVIKATLAEITDETNEGRAFTLIPITFAAGSIIGPALGGYLADPTEQYPHLFGNSAFLQQFPYFLPCIVAATLNLLAIVIGFVFLQTPPPVGRGRADSSASTKSSSDAASSKGPKRTPLRALLTRPILMNVLMFGLLALHDSAFTVLVPLFAYTQPVSGGLGFKLSAIGTALSVNGFAGLAVQLVIFPPLQRRFGTLAVLRFVLIFFPLCWAMFPILNAAARAQQTILVWVLLNTTLAVKTFSNTSIVCATLLVNKSAPSRSTLGAINGLAQAAGASARAIGPLLSTSLFAATISKHLAGGYLVWLVMFGISSIVYATSWALADPRVARESAQDAVEDEGRQDP